MGHSIIKSNRYFSLATCYDNQVWVAPICYVYKESDNAFYFYSDKNSKHARHMLENPEVAVAIFDSTATSDDASGLQIKAIASEVLEDELQAVMKCYFESLFPDENERQKWSRPKYAFINEAPHRFYKLVPLEAYINDVDKDMIDYRKEVKL